MYRNILIATDGSAFAQKAVAQGLALAKTLNAKTTVVTVTGPWPAIAPGEVGIAYPVEEYEKAAAANAARILAAPDRRPRAILPSRDINIEHLSFAPQDARRIGPAHASVNNYLR